MIGVPERDDLGDPIWRRHCWRCNALTADWHLITPRHIGRPGHAVPLCVGCYIYEQDLGREKGD